MEAEIKDDVITINWISDEGESTSVFWVGSYDVQKIPVTNTPGNPSVTKTRRIKNRWLPQMILRSSLIKMENSLIR